jgi:hypothetical protein
MDTAMFTTVAVRREEAMMFAELANPPMNLLDPEPSDTNVSSIPSSDGSAIQCLI